MGRREPLARGKWNHSNRSSLKKLARFLHIMKFSIRKNKITIKGTQNFTNVKVKQKPVRVFQLDDETGKHVNCYSYFRQQTLLSLSPGGTWVCFHASPAKKDGQEQNRGSGEENVILPGLPCTNGLSDPNDPNDPNDPYDPYDPCESKQERAIIVAIVYDVCVGSYTEDEPKSE